jgi:hypothetical protein
MKKTLLVLVVILAAFPAMSLDLTRSKSLPAIDGALTAGEYAWSMGGSQLRLGLAISEDGSTLYVAVEATTSGWVSIGLGSKQMDGAHIFMGAAGRVVEQGGSGHGHSDVARALAQKSAAKSEGGKSTLEFSVPATAYVKGGSLDLIVAYGTSQALGSMHAGQGSIRVAVK